MEVLDTNLSHLKATSTIESLLSHTSNVKKDLVSLCANTSSEYPEYVDLKGLLYSLANDPTTPASLLDHISTVCPVVLSESIAGNGNASKRTLLRLANHDNPHVRAAITENCNAPIEILACLCEDENPDVRFAMAENPRLPKSLLVKLVTDDNPYVASRAGTTLKRLEGIY